MAATRIQPHHPLPAPAVHAGFSVPQSKSYVLAGVQDAYWSDDEIEDAECPLCLEEMDVSDLNFKPCVCGYQICRFCWHHIKENLNKRCPACRRIYTDEGVEFKPINKEDHKRLMQQKKLRERERKELDAVGRRHLANVRVVQRNVVYVVGIGPRFAKEELIPTLRSEDYFGKYGRISKILLVKRTPPGGGEPVVGLYITYHRREDAARAIGAVDGAASPSGGREIMRASYGTTKYCMSFLRGANCNDQNCMNLHEWGDEKDCFTKEDLTTLKHTIKQTESRSREARPFGKKVEEHDAGLPRAASWAAQKGTASSYAAQSSASGSVQGSGTSTVNRQGRRGGAIRHPRAGASTTHISLGEVRSTSAKLQEKKATVGPTVKPASQASLSRPGTPASAVSAQRPVTPPDVKVLRTQRDSPYLLHSPAPSTTADSEHWSSSQDAPSSAVPSTPAEATVASIPSTPAVPPGIPVVPPGLSAPPGIALPSRPPRIESASPQTPLLSSQTTYQMSKAARALIDDVKARRGAVPSSTVNPSPFPDFDRTLQSLSRGDDGGFSFNLDPKLAHQGKDFDEPLPVFDEANPSSHGPYVESFRTIPSPHSAAFPPPSLPYAHYQDNSKFDPSSAQKPAIIQIDRQSSNTSSYIGSFNPFSDSADDTVSSSPARSNSVEDETGRRVSRFGFARGRQGSTTTLHPSLPTNTSSGDSQAVYCSVDSYQGSQPWSLSARQGNSYSHPNSAMGSPLMQLAPHVIHPSHSPARFQPFDSPDSSLGASLSEAQLREFIQSSRERANAASSLHNITFDQNSSVKLPFNDPAIMSASLGTPIMESDYSTCGGPPGLVPPPGLVHSAAISSPYMSINPKLSNTQGSADGPESNSDPPNPLSTVDFPALSASSPEEQSYTGDGTQFQDAKLRERAERKAAKQAAAAERTAERQKIAQEKAALRAAERAKAAQERAADKERLAALRAEEQRLERERTQKEKEKEREKAMIRREAQEKGKTPVSDSTKCDSKKIKGIDGQRVAKRPEMMLSAQKNGRQASASKVQQAPAVEPEAIVELAPLLSKKPKKNKPVASARLVRLSKEGEQASEDAFPLAPSLLDVHPVSTVGANSMLPRSQTLDHNSPTPLEDIFDELDLCYPWMDLVNHPFFDLNKVNPAAKMPLEYGPLVHALSALSVGGGSFTNNMPSGSIDNAVSSFQQLLETLTQTISDLLRLLPRTTWDDSSSFDGVLRDMLRGDDFLDDAGDEGQNKEDEVAALTLALERRARWMEVQLSKLEELHRDINLAAVRAVLSFNDNGWDRSGFLPRIGNTLKRYDSIGMLEEGGSLRPMTVEELEKKVIVAKEAAVFAEVEVKEAIGRMQSCKPLLDYY